MAGAITMQPKIRRQLWHGDAVDARRPKCAKISRLNPGPLNQLLLPDDETVIASGIKNRRNPSCVGMKLVDARFRETYPDNNQVTSYGNCASTDFNGC